MRTLHGVWASIAILVTAGVGLWTLLLVALRVKPGRSHRLLSFVVAGALLGQVVLGLLTLQAGYRPASDVHIVIGFAILGALLAGAWLWKPLLARPAVSGIILMALAGLGVVAMGFVSA